MKSWIESANDPGTDFPIENLPYGVFEGGICVAIGDSVLSLRSCAEKGFLEGLTDATVEAARGTVLNGIMALGAGERSALRARVGELLRAGYPRDRELAPLLIPIRSVAMRKPVEIGDYTDFYASVFHATNVGRLFRPDSPLLPNYKYVPIGYHGRASSIVVSGTDIRRPCGQTRSPGGEAPVFGPTRSLDYELEMGFFVAENNPLGQTVPIEQAGSRIFGLCLVNDWSARDIQAWEYQPLGPFLSKNFATSISPWVVPIEALAPFRTPAFRRPPGDPEPLPYLFSPEDQASGAFDVWLEVCLSTAIMRERGVAPVRISRSNLRDLYWTPAQLLAHHSSNGCNLKPGDLLASGTVSGETKDARGCLLERTSRGAEPIELPDGETRCFLEDGDEIVMRAFCERDNFARIGFGECRGTIAGSRSVD
ncbi:MAG TPA: fumarylacetoacetase [Bryobacteraceae bacterium]|nr:fumarylacetoacetase [Bryobacteraceae bacterium]